METVFADWHHKNIRRPAAAGKEQLQAFLRAKSFLTIARQMAIIIKCKWFANLKKNNICYLREV